MKLVKILVFVVLSWSCPYAQESLRPSQPVAFVGGMLLDGYEAEPIHHATVIINNGIIVDVGESDSLAIPDNAVVIDIGGKTIMPGLIDAHVHTDLIGHGDYTRYYKFLNGIERINDVMPIAAKQMLRAGVTSAIDLGTPFQILDLRDKIRRGEIPGPRLTVSGPWITRVSWDGIPPEYETVVTTTEEAVHETKKNIENGSDVIKLWAGMTQEDYYAVVEEAHKHNIKVHAHLYDPDDIKAAINAGVDVFQHVGSGRNPPYDQELLSDIAHKKIPIVQTISHRIWIYPETVHFPERLHDPIHRKDMPEDIYNEVINSFINFHRLSYFDEIGLEVRNSKIASRQFIESGAYMGVGTDAASPMNFHSDAMWFEMSALVDSGMTPIQVISAATKTNAEILGQIDELGTVEPGKLADVIVIDGNPLSNIDNMANVEIVVKDGVIYYSESRNYGAVKLIGHSF
tara:strand:- start:1914 stop:3287 length:1374 start_codon:yes stop_codon:yes gene_type:complete